MIRTLMILSLMMSVALSSSCGLFRSGFSYVLVAPWSSLTGDVDGEIAGDEPESTDHVYLTRNVFEEDDPALANNKKSVVFASDRDGDWDLYFWKGRNYRSEEDAAVDQLTNHPGEDRRPSWSPDAKYIAFDSDRTGEFEIYVMKRDGSEVRQLTHGEGANMAPQWSPSGERILFHSTRDGNTNVYMMNADGSRQLRLTGSAASDEFAAWSSDGSSIVFLSSRDRRTEVYLLDLEGMVETRVTDNPFDKADPAWCGGEICFTMDHGVYGVGIYAVQGPGAKPIFFGCCRSLAMPASRG